MKETQLIKQILDFCERMHLLFWRNQSGMIKTDHNSLMKFGKAGSPDLIGCFHGRFVGVECKVGKNKTTPLQEAFGLWIKQNGGEYWVVYDLDEFVLQLDNFSKTLNH